jgi:hypothetical protein
MQARMAATFKPYDCSTATHSISKILQDVEIAHCHLPAVVERSTSNRAQASVIKRKACCGATSTMRGLARLGKSD